MRSFLERIFNGHYLQKTAPTKINIGYKIIVILFLLFATPAYSQLVKTDYCILDNFFQIPDSVNDFSVYNPSPCITLKG